MVTDDADTSEPDTLTGRVKEALRHRFEGPLRRIEDRFFGVVFDLTRVTNDGSYQAMEDAADKTRKLPHLGKKRRGLRGG